MSKMNGVGSENEQSLREIQLQGPQGAGRGLSMGRDTHTLRGGEGEGYKFPRGGHIDAELVGEIVGGIP